MDINGGCSGPARVPRNWPLSFEVLGNAETSQGHLDLDLNISETEVPALLFLVSTVNAPSVDGLVWLNWWRIVDDVELPLPWSSPFIVSEEIFFFLTVVVVLEHFFIVS